MVKLGMTSLVMGSKIYCISGINGWNEPFFLHASAKSGKLKVISMILGWPWSEMV